MSSNFKLSIKSLLFKTLNENEQFFYLAPDIVGSVNNAYPVKGKKIFVVDFNTTDNRNVKMAVPYHKYKEFNEFQSTQDSGQVISNFVKAYLNGAKPCDKFQGQENDMLDEMVDDYGNLYGKEDEPANIKSNPGQNNKKNSSSALHQMGPGFSRFVGPLGYGSVIW